MTRNSWFFIQNSLPKLDSISGMVRVASSAGSCRRCTWRDWHGWSYCPLGLWKEENCRLQEMHQVIEICNRKVPDFSSRIDSQGWSACQAWSGWTPQPDPVGVVHGEAGVTDPEVMHFHKEKSCLFHSLQIFLNWLFMFLLAPRRYIWATESRNLLEQTPNVWIIKYDTCPIFHPEFTPKAGQHVRHSQGGLIGRIQSALYTEDLALLDLDVMRVYGKETTD